MPEKRNTVFKYGELFCGPGGLALGAMRAQAERGAGNFSIRHEWANDYDLDSCGTYTRNIARDRPDTVIHEDIRKLDLESLNPIDIFAYGFPCNDFSIVGEQKGFDGKYGPLYTYGVKALSLFKPKFFVAENVNGMSSANNGKALEKILSDLSSAGNGYRLTVHKYKAEEYGVPQTRHRIIIVGIDEELGLEFNVPKPTHQDSYVSVRETLESPPIKEGAPNNEKTVQSKRVVERLKHIKPGQNAWDADIPEELQLNVKSARMSQIYKRLDPDRPSYTITGSGGGGTHGYHYDEPRALTNRERARIQTFPDSFIFEGNKESVRKQIGMAVPPKLSEIIFTAILKTFAGIEYPCVDANISIQFELMERT